MSSQLSRCLRRVQLTWTNVAACAWQLRLHVRHVAPVSALRTIPQSLPSTHEPIEPRVAPRRQHAAGRRRARLPAGRAVLAVRRSAGAADRRGARAARIPSWPKRCSARRAAVLGLARVPARSTARTTSGRWRWRAPRPSTSRSAPAPTRPRTGRGSIRRTRAQLRDLFEIVGRFDATEVLIDDRPVPYARELWLPLLWFLIR